VAQTKNWTLTKKLAPAKSENILGRWQNKKRQPKSENLLSSLQNKKNISQKVRNYERCGTN
jgi:hypothetical protein